MRQGSSPVVQMPEACLSYLSDMCDDSIQPLPLVFRTPQQQKGLYNLLLRTSAYHKGRIIPTTAKKPMPATRDGAGVKAVDTAVT